jgi:hypothetical protein
MKRLSIIVSITAFSVFVVYFGWSYYSDTALRHRTEIGYMHALMNRIRQCKADNIKKVVIADDEMGMVELLSEKDYSDIKRILYSLQHATIENRERTSNSTAILIFYLAKPVEGYESFRIDGNFDPNKAPNITSSMRSDNLGRIIHEILVKKTSK